MGVTPARERSRRARRGVAARRRAVPLTAAVALALLAAAVAAQVTVDDFEAHSFTDSRGTTLHYRLFVPGAYAASAREPISRAAGIETRRYPLVTFLAGNGSQGSDNRRQVREGALLWAQPEVQARQPAFVLSPQCPADDGWGRPAGLAGYPAGSPLEALLDLLDEIERRYPIDPDRRYITGMSGGGWGTLRALARRPDSFAAAILVCPAGEPARNPEVPPSENGVGVVAGLERLPLWFFHGTDDDVVPLWLTEERVEVLREAGGSPRLTIYPGVEHDAWVKAYAEPEIVDWLYSFRRGTAAPAR